MSEAKVALVTGASRGIGQAIADGLAAMGCIVVGTATTQAGAKSINDRLTGFGGAGLILDVASQESVDQCLAELKERFGLPTIVVNNAGILQIIY